MPALVPFYQLLGLDRDGFSKSEISALELNIFMEIYTELKNYFDLANLKSDGDAAMLETEFTKSILKDILSSGYYSIRGIAYYTGIDEDLIVDILSGRYASNSVIFVRKILELHRTVKVDFYKEIIRKLKLKYLNKPISTSIDPPVHA